MATNTLGTNGTTTLTAVRFLRQVLTSVDLAAVATAIRDDANVTVDNTGQIISGAALANMPSVPSAFSREGLLFIPNRGALKVLPNDWVAVDATGWPILLSATAIAGVVGAATSWTHS